MVRYHPCRHLAGLACSLFIYLYPVNGLADSPRDTSPSRIQLISSLASAGRAEAQYALARIYLSGDGLEQDLDKGVHWLTKAADQDHAPAQNRLGLLYTEGRGLDIDCNRAEHWFTRIPPESPVYSSARANLAWLLATCPDRNYRDGQRALLLVQKLLQNSDSPDALLLDTQAAAWAEIGRFDQAISTQQQALHALESSANPQLVQRFNRRMQHYRNNRPWRLADRDPGNEHP